MAEMHSSAQAVAKRMWSYLRAVFLMARKGLLSNKRKLLLTMHLLAKRRGRINKAVARTVDALLHSSHSHHSQYHHHHSTALRRQEFSCTNSPAAAADPASSSSRRHLAYFPSCLGADDYAASPAPPQETPARIEYCYYVAADSSYSPAPVSSPGLLVRDDLAAPRKDEEDQCCAGASPDLLVSAAAGRFSVRVSNYSSEDEGAHAAGGEAIVDHDAEEFIRRFYDQLRRQNAVAMLPYTHEAAAA